MSLNEHAIGVITRPLPKDKIKKRPGKAGMEFSYITPDFVIETLNEAFNYDWNTKIVSHDLQDNVAVVGLELSVGSDTGQIVKQQFGSCEVTRGLGVGEAFKGATSDALKKCATLLGLGLELYQADEAPGGPPAPPSFQPPPNKPTSRPAAPPSPLSLQGAQLPKPVAAPPPPQQPNVPRPPAPPAKPARPPADRETRISPSAGPGSGPPKPNPFVTGAGTVKMPNPPSQVAVGSAGRAAPTPRPNTPASAAPRVSPFASTTVSSSGPNATQVNALTNLAKRKELSPAELISTAGVVDDLGHPVQTFEDLTREQAIQVIKAAQQ